MVGHEHPRAGWYDDPETSGALRFWDGDRWTDDRAVATGFDHPGVGRWARLHPALRVLVVAVLAVAGFLLLSLGSWLFASTL